MTIVKASPDIETEACCIADPHSRPNAILLARARGIVRSQGELEVLHIRLICGQHLLCSKYRGTGTVLQSTKMQTRGTTTFAEPDC
jgi:hypothetical protein